MKSKESTVNLGKAWLVTLTAALFFFYEFVQMIMPSAINVQLMQSFHLNAASLGWLVSMYYIANALFVFHAGYFLDRYSTKKLLLGAIAICTVGTFVFGYAQTFTGAAMGRFAVGIGAAFCFLSSMRVASRWFPPRRMALVSGVVVTMAMIGGFVAQTPMVLLSDWLGWRHAMYVNASFGILVALAVYFIVQDRPPSVKEHETCETHKPHISIMKAFKLVILNRNNWLGGVYTSLLNLPVCVFGGLWGVSYLVQVHHLSKVQASYATSLMFVGVIFGSPAYGWISDHMGKRCTPMIIGGILSFFAILALMYLPDLSLTSLMILFFLIGFLTSSQVLPYPAIAELNPPALTGTALGLASFLIMSSGYVFLPLFGWLLERSGDKALVDGITVYSAHDYTLAIWMMPISFIIGLVIAMLMRETNCELQVHE